ncbi:O-antigen ligase family protein [Microvirga antarctica]|uniref:O-antigen ligase family protein n=1 Tax=Microvirga antarctica TaxID=2819233 RepID=UPI001B312CB4|nr:O-antigen ligase family protein [Microvirga antarctica]
MSVVDRSDRGHLARAAGLSAALWRVAMGALAVLPVGMAVAHRSSPLFLGLAAVAAVAAVLLDGQGRSFARAAIAQLATPLGISVAAFFAWGLASIGWSEFPAVSLLAFGEFWLSVAFAWVLAVTLPERMTRQAFGLLALSCCIAAAIVVVELRTGMVLRRMLDVRANSFIFNRPVLTLTLLLPAVALWLWRQKGFGAAAAAGAASLVAVAVFQSDSGAAVLGLVVAAFTFAAACLGPRLVALVGAFAFSLALVLAPVMGTIGDRAIPDSVHRRLADDHSRDRVDIWLSFNDAIRQDPVLGGGFGVSPVMDKTSVADRVAPEHRVLLGVGHPHNAAIQVWAELGIVGAVLTLMIILQILRLASRQSRPIAAASLALMAGAASVALVGHGAWQGWWAASLGAAIVWLLALRDTAPRTRVETTR